MRLRCNHWNRYQKDTKLHGDGRAVRSDRLFGVRQSNNRSANGSYIFVLLCAIPNSRSRAVPGRPIQFLSHNLTPSSL